MGGVSKFLVRDLPVIKVNKTIIALILYAKGADPQTPPSPE